VTDNWPPPDAVVMPITDELDLHTFRPRDLRTLLPDYIDECVEKGISPVRIIHGKGTGALRRGVHALLERDPRVLRFELCGAGHGGWGATRAWLRTSPLRDP
jgi:dsDNA-specific endonuclease/ATPase MutS2